MSFDRIVVATDFSDSSREALELALPFAEKCGSELTLVHCWEAPSYSYAAGLYLPLDVIAPIERAAVARLEEATTQLKLRYPSAKSLLRAGAPWEEVLSAAVQVKADLIVMTTDGRNGFLDALRGSHSERILRRTPCPLLAIPERSSLDASL